jgi:hypothetical protein
MGTGNAAMALMKTHIVAEQALQMLIEDYKAGKDATTYGQLARRGGFEGQQNARWFGQVTDLIDASWTKIARDEAINSLRRVHLEF